MIMRSSSDELTLNSQQQVRIRNDEEVSQQRDESIQTIAMDNNQFLTPITRREVNEGAEGMSQYMNTSSRMEEAVKQEQDKKGGNDSMSLISSEATMVFKQSAVGIGMFDHLANTLFNAPNRSRRQNNQDSTLNLDADEPFEDVTNSMAQNGFNLQYLSLEEGPSFKDASFSDQNSLSIIQTVEYTTSLQQIAATKSPTKEIASKAKHEQRRNNLRRKRAHEQLLQVVECYLRDHTIITTMQTFMEANFLNDMMNVQHDIISNVIQNESRKIIRGVLSDIYYAHIATLFLENLMLGELKIIAQEILMVNSQNILENSSQISSGIDETFKDELIYEESTIRLEEVQMEIGLQKWSEALPATKIFDQELELNLISDHLLNTFLSHEIRDLSLKTLSANETANLLSSDLFTQTLHSHIQNLYIETFLDQKFIPLLLTSLLSDSLTHYLTQEALFSDLFSNLINTQTTVVFKESVELEYFARTVYEEILVETLIGEIESEYEGQRVSEMVSSKIIDGQVKEVVCRTVAEIRVEKREIERQVVKQIGEQVMQTETKNQAVDVLLDMIMDDFVSLFSENLIDNLTSHTVILDSIFDELLVPIIKKEVSFQLQLEKDAHSILQALLQNQISAFNPRQEPKILNQQLEDPTKTNDYLSLVIKERRNSEQRRNKKFQQQQIISINLADDIVENTTEPIQVVNQESDLLCQDYLEAIINSGVENFSRNIITSLILPHQIYKKIMSRIIRKTTYAAIQQAVDIAYRLEEDTINVADKLLDKFVEQQIREMVQEYPNKNNQQRRSHTILIDTSDDKIMRRSSQSGLPLQQQTPASQFCINYPQQDEKRTRNGLNSIIPNQNPRQNSKGNNGCTLISINQTKTDLMYISDDKSDQSHITAQNIKEEPLIVSKITRQINYQSQNKRYNTCMTAGQFTDNQTMSEEELAETLSSQYALNEEIRGRQHPSNFVITTAHHGRTPAKVDMSFQMQNNNYPYGAPQPIPGPHKQLNGDHRGAYKSHGAASSAVSGVMQGVVGGPSGHHQQRGLSDTTYYSNNGVIFSQSQEASMAIDWQSQGGLINNKVNQGSFISKNLSRASQDSVTLETRIIPTQESAFRTLNPKHTANNFDQRKRSTGGIPIVPVQYQIYSHNRPSDMTSPEELQLDDETTPQSTLVPPQPNEFKYNQNTFRNMKTEDVPTNTSMFKTGDNMLRQHAGGSFINLGSPKNQQFLFHPGIRQFESIQSVSSSSKNQPRINRPVSGVPFVELSLVDNYSNTKKNIQNVKSPQLDQYFGRANKNGGGGHKNQKSRSNSKKRVMIDLRQAMAAQTEKKKSITSTPINIGHNANPYPQIFNQPNSLIGGGSDLSRDSTQKGQSVQGNISHSKQNNLTNKQPTVNNKQIISPQESIVKLELQKLVLVLKQRVQECKNQAQQKGVGPSTSLLMTQLVCDVLHSLAEQILNVGSEGYETHHKSSAPDFTESSKQRQQLFNIDKKIKELVQKIQTNQSLMSKQNYQLSMLLANQVAMLNYQKLTLIMQPQTKNFTNYDIQHQQTGIRS